MNECLSWGRYPRVSQRSIRFDWRHSALPLTEELLLPYGQGRSYGDSCLNQDNVILTTSGLNRLISFNSESGVLRCEAGTTLAQILDFAVPRGWFLPVTPGTKFVSIGGAIANDVHGKNHHCAGTFGRHIERFELLRSDGERLICSANTQSDLFKATIGGLGLTGLILWADLQLIPVQGANIDVENIKFTCFDEFFEISKDSDSDQSYPYTVAWLDCLAKDSSFGRGIFMRGRHSQSLQSPRKPLDLPLGIPIDFPGWVLNHATIKLFNYVYYNKQRVRHHSFCTHYQPFFYPLDAVANWNRIYGRRGLFQFQCAVPSSKDQSGAKSVLKAIVASGRASFLAVAKEFGSIESPGMLSFPRPGVTLCLDFPNQGAATLTLMKELEALVGSLGGALYPAKDACMSGSSFKNVYPQWKLFSSFIDPRFSSSFWRRVTQEE